MKKFATLMVLLLIALCSCNAQFRTEKKYFFQSWLNEGVYSNGKVSMWWSNDFVGQEYEVPHEAEYVLFAMHEGKENIVCLYKKQNEIWRYNGSDNTNQLWYVLPGEFEGTDQMLLNKVGYGAYWHLYLVRNNKVYILSLIGDSLLDEDLSAGSPFLTESWVVTIPDEYKNYNDIFPGFFFEDGEPYVGIANKKEIVLLYDDDIATKGTKIKEKLYLPDEYDIITYISDYSGTFSVSYLKDGYYKWYDTAEEKIEEEGLFLGDAFKDITRFKKEKGSKKVSAKKDIPPVSVKKNNADKTIDDLVAYLSKYFDVYPSYGFDEAKAAAAVGAESFRAIKLGGLKSEYEIEIYKFDITDPGAKTIFDNIKQTHTLSVLWTTSAVLVNEPFVIWGYSANPKRKEIIKRFEEF